MLSCVGGFQAHRLQWPVEIFPRCDVMANTGCVAGVLDREDGDLFKETRAASDVADVPYWKAFAEGNDGRGASGAALMSPGFTTAIDSGSVPRGRFGRGTRSAVRGRGNSTGGRSGFDGRHSSEPAYSERWGDGGRRGGGFMAERRGSRGRGRVAESSRGWNLEKSAGRRGSRDSGSDAWLRGGWVDRSVNDRTTDANAAVSLGKAKRGDTEPGSEAGQANNGASASGPAAFEASAASSVRGPSSEQGVPCLWRWVVSADECRLNSKRPEPALLNLAWLAEKGIN